MMDWIGVLWIKKGSKGLKRVWEGVPSNYSGQIVSTCDVDYKLLFTLQNRTALGLSCTVQEVFT